ncbi:hypothetical protein FJ365_01465 [Candidatus Dependentiae bacterium]|nr:hypothetical protein [Candidatus Dependentiae bacterium]
MRRSYYIIFVLMSAYYSLLPQIVEIGIRNCFDAEIYVTYRMGAQSDRLCVRRIRAHHKELIHVSLPEGSSFPLALCELLIDFKISSGTLSWFLTEEVKAFIQRSADGWNGFALYVSPAHDGRITVNWIRYRFQDVSSIFSAGSKKKKVRFATINRVREPGQEERFERMKK